jgi:XTP/dITP diphosphohydrolase
VELGDALFALVATARARGLDPEAELRAATRRYAQAVRAAEGHSSGSSTGSDRSSR